MVGEWVRGKYTLDNTYIMAKRKNTNTNQVVLVNHTTNEITGYVNKGKLAQEEGINHETIVNWFRDGVRIAKANIRGCECSIFKLDKYYSKYS